MKINGITPPSPATAGRSAARPATDRPTEAAGDAVHLSKASGALGSQATVNAEKVAEIRLAIVEGRFMINSSAIADRLISSAREMIDAQRRD